MASPLPTTLSSIYLLNEKITGKIYQCVYDVENRNERTNMKTLKWDRSQDGWNNLFSLYNFVSNQASNGLFRITKSSVHLS